MENSNTLANSSEQKTQFLNGAAPKPVAANATANAQPAARPMPPQSTAKPLNANTPVQVKKGNWWKYLVTGAGSFMVGVLATLGFRPAETTEVIEPPVETQEDITPVHLTPRHHIGTSKNVAKAEEVPLLEPAPKEDTGGGTSTSDEHNGDKDNHGTATPEVVQTPLVHESRQEENAPALSINELLQDRLGEIALEGGIDDGGKVKWHHANGGFTYKIKGQGHKLKGFITEESLHERALAHAGATHENGSLATPHYSEVDDLHNPGELHTGEIDHDGGSVLSIPDAEPAIDNGHDAYINQFSTSSSANEEHIYAAQDIAENFVEPNYFTDNND